MSKWKEIKYNYYNEEENQYYIDAWVTNSPNEEGKVIAKIDAVSEKITYLDEDAKTDDYARSIIRVVIDIIKDKKREVSFFPKNKPIYYIGQFDHCGDGTFRFREIHSTIGPYFKVLNGRVYSVFTDYYTEKLTPLSMNEEEARANNHGRYYQIMEVEENRGNE